MESDLDLLTQELKIVEEHWENIGRGLGHKESNMEDIRTSYSTSHDHLRETLSRWLKGRFDPIFVTVGFVPFWRNVVDALRVANVGQSQLADQLEAKYCPSEFINNNILLYFSEYNVVQHCTRSTPHKV